MPTIRALSRTEYVASLSTISFNYYTILSQDADFGLPNLNAFSINSNPGLNFFFHRRTVS